MRAMYRFCLVLSFLLAGCDTAGGASATGGGDTGTADTGSADVASTDAAGGQTDATTGGSDSGPTDTTTADASTADTTSPDTASADVPTQPSVSKGSTTGKYSVQLTGPTALKAGQNATYQALISGESGGAAEGLDVKVSFIHTAMGHGGLKNPTIDEDGGGAYTVKNVQPSMSGVWALSFKIGTEKATFEVTVTK